MKRLVTIGLLLLLASCKKKAEPVPKPEDVVEKHRARAEKRLDVLKKIAATLTDGPLARIEMGSRPKIDLPWTALKDPREGAQDVSNARLLSASDLEKTDPPAREREDPLLQDLSWLRNVREHLKAPKAGSAPTAERNFEVFFRIRYVAILVTVSSTPPQIPSSGFSPTNFLPGSFTGHLHVVDLEDGVLLGGVEIRAANSEKVEFGHLALDGPDQERSSALYSLKKDVQEHIRKEARRALGGEVPAR